WYRNRLSHLLASRRSQFTYIAVTIILFALSLFGAVKAGLEFIPPMDQGELDIRVQFPMNYNLEKTESLLRRVEQMAAEYGEVKAIFTQLGNYDEFTRGSHTGKISIRMIPKNQRDFSMTEFANRIRPRLIDFPGAEFNVLLPKSFGPDDPAIDLRLMGSNPDTLRLLAGQIKQMMDRIPGCADAYIDSKTGRPELKIIPDMQKLSHYGLTVYHLAMAARLSMEGAEASTLREKGREYDIKVLYRADQVDDPAKIGYIPIQTQQGTIRLNEVARLEYGQGPTKATRINRMELVEIKANVASGTMGEITRTIQNSIRNDIPLPAGYSFSFGGDSEYLADAITDLTKAAILAIILTFMLMCALLESYSQPIMIMSTIPMSLIGVVASLLLTGTSLSLTSMISMIMLVGIVVNNAILMLDYTNELRRNGQSIDQALLEAGPVKLKPILMSTLAIMIGMLPMAWASGAGSEARAPIAIVSIGGLIITTFLTLFIIPTLYRFHEIRHEKSGCPIRTQRSD
ncbi:MAG: efflux RND transporter permease subunit, partial [Candidatus Delongbacteria bacterium]|nr:efflux RND transporter permease subunit [Candidatus Delongbacteria bacterium]